MSYPVAATTLGPVGPATGRLMSVTVKPSSAAAAWALVIQDQNGNDFVNVANVKATTANDTPPFQLIFAGLEFDATRPATAIGRGPLRITTLTNVAEVILEFA